MKLHGEPFDRIKDGDKTLEMRLYEDKRRHLELGDMIEFLKLPDLTEKVTVEVIALLRYKSFADLIEDMPAAYLGYEESEKDYLKANVYEYYTKEEEEKYGVLGIRMRLIEKK
jgi:ASC-1-like (ASCH) protein